MTTTLPYPMLTSPDAKFTDIASAATVNLDSAIGNYGQITGTTGITAITLSEGKAVWVRFTGALTITNSGTLVLPGTVNLTTAAGDWAHFVTVSGVVYCTQYFTSVNRAQSGSVCRAWAVFNGTTVGTNSPTAGNNVTSITRNGTGDYTVNIPAGVFSSGNYAAVVTCGRGAAGANAMTFWGPWTSDPTSTAFRFATGGSTFVQADVEKISIAFFGN